MNPEILFENDDVVVINKPSGVMVHEDGFHEGETVVDWFLGRAPTARGVGEPGKNAQGKVLERSGVVHRLDAETSGVLLLTKHQQAYEHIKQQFHDRLTKKEYRAFVYEHMRESWGTIDRPIGRSAKDFRLRSAQRGAKGTLRDAVTDWECIGKGEFEGEAYSYVKVKPKTGRTHQIRVHMKAIDRPIVCDELYAGSRVGERNNLDMSRLALHAYTLELTLPSGESQRFMAPLPLDFIEAEDKLTE